MDVGEQIKGMGRPPQLEPAGEDQYNPEGGVLCTPGVTIVIHKSDFWVTPLDPNKLYLNSCAFHSQMYNAHLLMVI